MWRGVMRHAGKIWKKISVAPPPINTEVYIAFIPVGAGGHRESWITKGRLRSFGKFSLVPPKEGFGATNEPNYWRYI